MRESKHIPMSVKCIEKARANTKLPFQLIIVETCSDYLEDYADIHIYEKNRTTADKSINRAFFCCDSQYTVLLTNDVMVSDGWLEALLEPFQLKEDCGISTLASDQFGHFQENKIEEGIWGSVFMIPSQYAMFDEKYVNSWEDSDLWMQMYLRGYKMYRNFNCVVSHNPGQTVYADKMTQDNYEKNRAYFLKKWENHKDTRIYKILTEGHVI
jgi:GT2 family glycosyltransferase